MLFFFSWREHSFVKLMRHSSLISLLSPGCCYETAMTRRFYHGRTETVRPCTVEAVEWCKSMLDPSASVNTEILLLIIMHLEGVSFELLKIHFPTVSLMGVGLFPVRQIASVGLLEVSLQLL